eukprot:3941078-Rhodomonas_salina.6
MVLPEHYAVRGTELAYGATRARVRCYAMSGTEVAYGMTREKRKLHEEVSAYGCAMRCPVLRKRMVLCGVRFPSLSAWRGRNQVSISLRACYAMSGTDIAYGAISLRACYAMSGTGTFLSAYPFATRRPVLTQRLSAYARATRSANLVLTTDPASISLRGCYAESGTDIAYGATEKEEAVFKALAKELRYPPTEAYAMSGTDIAHGSARRRKPYAMSDTEIAYRTEIAYGTFRLRKPYALSGTDIAYGATRGKVMMLKMGYSPPFGATHCSADIAYAATEALRDVRY